jgi:hypothetical protein
VEQAQSTPAPATVPRVGGERPTVASS